MKFGENIQADVWARLPATKYLAGRKRVRRMVERAVLAWPVDDITECFGVEPVGDWHKVDSGKLGKISAKLGNRIAYDEYGSILAMLFIGLASAIVQVLLEWWLIRSSHRIAFDLWSSELSE